MYKILKRTQGINFGKYQIFNPGDEVMLDDRISKVMIENGLAEEIVKHPSKDELEVKPMEKPKGFFAKLLRKG